MSSCSIATVGQSFKLTTNEDRLSGRFIRLLDGEIKVQVSIMDF